MASSTSGTTSSISNQSDIQALQEVSSVPPQVRKTKLIKQAAQAGVFISYAQADELFAVELTESLRNAGLPVWLDIFDIALDGDWRDEVNNALNRCGVMILILSPNMALDDDGWHEQVYFTEQHKAVIPVIYQPGNRIDKDFGIQPVDFLKSYAQGINVLLRLLT
jgi:hypothetical protein